MVFRDLIADSVRCRKNEEALRLRPQARQGTVAIHSAQNNPRRLCSSLFCQQLPTTAPQPLRAQNERDRSKTGLGKGGCGDIDFKRRSLWLPLLSCQYQGMESILLPHVPFAQLPTEARTLLHIFAVAAIARYNLVYPNLRELAPRIETVWNEKGLALAAISDAHRMTAFFKSNSAFLLNNQTGQAIGINHAGELKDGAS
jgi:hypothetical protein